MCAIVRENISGGVSGLQMSIVGMLFMRQGRSAVCYPFLWAEGDKPAAFSQTNIGPVVAVLGRPDRLPLKALVCPIFNLSIYF